MIGHAWAADLLRRHLEADAVRHAYLLTGPEGVGKRTLAVRMAQAWNCQAPPAVGDACGECRACRGIEAGTYPDLHRLQPEEEGGAIRVEAVRELERMLALAAYEGRGRVAILDSFHAATEGAANALLKTLEEPPPRVLMLLTAPAAEDLLPTVVSRCEVLRLRPVPREEIERALREEGAPEAEAQWLAAEAGGRPGWALRMWRDPKRRQAWAKSVEEMAGLLKAGRSERLAYAERLIRRWKELPSYEEKRAALLEHLEPWSGALRQAMRSALGLEAGGGGGQAVDDVARAGSADTVIRAVRALEWTTEAVRRNANLQLALEALLLELPYSKAA
jgi:DNA polymerase-3 subunit delta'